jgi:hypothetical protein
MAGLDVKVIKIESKSNQILREKPKKIIAINARTHSGEASSSWVLDGLI